MAFDFCDQIDISVRHICAIPVRRIEVVILLYQRNGVGTVRFVIVRLHSLAL